MLQEDYAERLDAEGNRLIGVVSSEAKRMGQLIDDLAGLRAPGPHADGNVRGVDMTALAAAAYLPA